MLVTPQEVVEAQHYNPDELDFVQTLILAAEAFLMNAGAYRITNDLTRATIILMVGCWLQNRELDFTDYKNVADFPLGVRSLITQLKYAPADPVETTEGDSVG